jgi:Tfp pilus assembly protein PilX
MLKTRPPRRGGRAQQGIVLLLSLVVLVAMTLAGLALLRSVFTSNRIAGNLAFQQAATQSADVGIETAIAWLENNSTGTRLHDHITRSGGEPVGYFANRQDPGVNQSWQEFWDAVLVPTNRVNTLPADAAGNTVAYVIQRLCNATGDPTGNAGCDVSPAVTPGEGNSRGAGSIGLQMPTQTYYRITARVTGPRNATSFVQVVVSL